MATVPVALWIAPLGEADYVVWGTYGVLFITFLLVFFVGLNGFVKFYQRYEEQYISETEKTVESMFLQIPAQQIWHMRVMCLIVTAILTMAGSGDVFYSIAFGMGGFLVPDLFIKVLKGRRLRAFNEQILDILGTMSNALKAGFSLPRAFEVLSTELPAPASQEFGLVLQELRLGAPPEEALENLQNRMPSVDLELMITSINVARSVGGNLTEVFESISDVIRERMRIEGRIKALTSQGKMQALVTSCLPIVIGLAIFIIDPELIEPLFTTGLGLVLLSGMAVFWIIGFILIRKITSIEV